MTKVLGYELRVSDAVPPGEAWLVRPEERQVVENAAGESAYVTLRPAQLLGRIVNCDTEFGGPPMSQR